MKTEEDNEEIRLYLEEFKDLIRFDDEECEKCEIKFDDKKVVKKKLDQSLPKIPSVKIDL